MPRFLLVGVAAVGVASGCFSEGKLANADGEGNGGAGGVGGSAAAGRGGADSADGGPRDGSAGSCGPWLSVDPPSAGTTFACPIDPICPPTWADVEAAQADGGTCGQLAAIASSVEVGACNGKRVWRAQASLWFRTCVYETDGTLVGSQYCTDTSCWYAGQALGANGCADADAGVTTTACAPAPGG